jgi:hypothetical protein
MPMFGSIILLLATTAADPATIPAEEAILKTLRPGHPRLIAPADAVPRVKMLAAEHPRAKEVYAKVRAEAEKLLDAKPVEYELIGPRLLHVSRRAVGRVYTLATVYRLEGDERFARRAIKEMLAVAAFKDWHPSHFLDTAEMTHAMAVGYDWLYDVLSPGQRETIRRAIVEKGLKAAEPFYREHHWWTTTHHNWNQVCNGGITLGALAVADEEPDLAAYILHQACHSVQIAMREFAPDGACVEGPSYWNYATRYNVLMLAGLETALGTDFGLSRFEGFSVTGDFPIYTLGPTRRTFNFADAGDRQGEAPQLFWLARKFDRPLYAWFEREYIAGDSPRHLWWFDPRGEKPDDLPLDRHFRRAGVVMLRSRWHDPRAVFVGFKGGSNAVNHSHLELGTFVLDADGVRWAVDLGPDDYNLPRYFGSKRWTYYRLATEGQNTLVIDGKNQDPQAAAPITVFRSKPDDARAVADLTAAYKGHAESVRRGMALLDRKVVLIQDELSGTEGSEITWQMHTEAEVDTEGNKAVLRQGDETLRVRILEPKGAAFAVASATPPPPQRQNEDVRKLVIRLPGRADPLRLAVLLVPGSVAEPSLPAIEPLDRW